MAKSSDEDLPDGVRHIAFKQGALIKAYSDSSIHLNQRGVCAGLCTDYYRFYKKREKASIYKGTNISQVSFLYKNDLRPYIKAADDLAHQPRHSAKTNVKDKDSFARRVQFYQIISQNHKPMKKGQLQDINFKGLFDNTNYLEISLSESLGNHAITAIKLCDENGHFLEYRLFDPNLGEYQNIKTIENLEICFNLVLSIYHKSPFISYQISDYEESFKTRGYDLVNNKKIFRFIDAMKEPMKLDKEQLKEILAELPIEAKNSIGNLLPNDLQATLHILRLAPDQILCSCKATYSVLKFAERNAYQDIKDLIIENQKYLVLKDKDGYTTLHLAAQLGHTEIANALIEKMNSQDLTLQDKDGYTSLHYAALNGHTDIAKALIEKMNSQDLTLQDKDGYTSLHCAALNGHTDIAKALMEKMNSQDLVLQNTYGYIALHWAAIKGHTNTAKALIEKMHSQDLALKDKNGDTALHHAAIRGHTDIAKALIEKTNSQDLTLQEKHDYTALHCAAIRGHTDIAKALIEKMNSQDLTLRDKNGDTALHCAAINDHTKIVFDLIVAGISSDLKNNNGKMALDVAKGDSKTLLESTNLSLYAKLQSGERIEPLTNLIKALQTEEAKILINQLDIKDIALLKDKDGMNLLNISRKLGNKEIESLILKRINALPPLHQAVLDNNIKQVEELSKNTKDLNSISNMGNTALHIAASKGYDNIVHILLKNGIDTEIKNPDGKTALDVAKGNTKSIIATHKFLKDNANLKADELKQKIIEIDRPQTFVGRLKRLVGRSEHLNHEMIKQSKKLER